MSQPKRYEFKLTVLPKEEHIVRAQLEEKGAEMRMREVYFYDTPGLDLKERHLFLRARRTEGKEADSTVKLRPLPKGGAPAEWKGTDYRYEADVIGDDEIRSFKLDRPEGEIRGDDVGGHAARVFDQVQASIVKVPWADLRPFGPIHAHLWEDIKYDGLPNELSIEEWTVSGGPHFIELSFKVKRDEKADAKQALRALLKELKLDPKGDPDPKTTRMLEFFAAQ